MSKTPEKSKKRFSLSKRISQKILSNDSMASKNNKDAPASAVQPQSLKSDGEIGTPRPEHPRPHWVRPGKKWINLNGQWAFAFDDKAEGIDAGWWKWDGKNKDNFARTINVPFAYQWPLSGINDEGSHEVCWYARTIAKPEDLGNNRVILRFGAVDYQADVWVDGSKVVQHKGGHVPFSADITSNLKFAANKEVPLVVRVRDRPFDVLQPRGKQNWSGKPNAIWYKPTTGIWQSVWLEYAPSRRIGRTILRPDIDAGTLTVKANIINSSAGLNKLPGGKLKVDVKLGKYQITSGTTTIAEATEEALVTLDMRLMAYDLPNQLKDQQPPIVWDRKGLALWSPDHPNIYDVTMTLQTEKGEDIDVVDTYTGMRKIHIANGKIYLNNERIFQALNLDQGYWTEGGMTAPTDEAFKTDIKRMKDIGMNGCRKHQKVEDPRFMYWADRMGYMVWAEMPSPQQWHEKAMLRVQREWTESMMAQINFPCIISWTPYNESWGVDDLLTSERQRQWCTAIYSATKALDPTRLCIGNDGWEMQRQYIDVIGYHDYEQAEAVRITAASVEKIIEPKGQREIILKPDTYNGQPIINTELGGISLKQKEGEGGKDDWGYNEAHDEQELLKRMRGLVSALIDGDIVQGFCYTQTTDTTPEINGICKADRTYKASQEELKKIFSMRPKW